MGYNVSASYTGLIHIVMSRRLDNGGGYGRSAIITYNSATAVLDTGGVLNVFGGVLVTGSGNRRGAYGSAAIVTPYRDSSGNSASGIFCCSGGISVRTSGCVVHVIYSHAVHSHLSGKRGNSV